MAIDEKILSTSFSDLVNESMYIELEQSGSKEYGLVLYDYCTVDAMKGYYSFLGLSIDKLAIKVDDDKRLKEVLLILKVWDAKEFYNRMEKKYGMPNTTSLSKFYLEKYGYKTPPEIGKDELQGYYESLPQPTTIDLPELRSMAWYDLNDTAKNLVPTDILVRNKSNSSDKFEQKEIWVSIKRSK